MDAFEIATWHDTKTLNGYSGQNPQGWNLFNVTNDEYYMAYARGWIRSHNLKNVYAYDIGKNVWLNSSDFATQMELNGTEIKFHGDDSNAGRFCTGISGKESWGTWTDGNELLVQFKANENFAGKHLRADFTNSVFNGSQKVIVFAQGEKVLEQDVTGGFSFDFNVGSDRLVDIKIELPEATSPYELGQSNDMRILALGLQKIDFSVITESENIEGSFKSFKMSLPCLARQSLIS